MTNGKKIFGAFALAIALFFVWPAIIGSWQEMQALRSKLAESEQLNKDRTTILTNAQDMLTKYQTILGSSAGRSFAALVPIQKDSAELVSAVQDMSSSSGIQLNEIRLNEVKGKTTDAYRTLSLTLDLSGSYQALRTFLGSLEQYVRVLDVKSIDVSTGSAQQSGLLKFIIAADTYFIK